MSERDLGRATIVYEDPEDGHTEQTVDNELIVYGRDHWAVKTGTDERGNDQMLEIPRDRVYRVERDVERFEEEVRTVRHRVESLASGIREKLPVDVGEGHSERTGRRDPEEWDERQEESATTVPVTGGERDEE